MPDRPEEHDAPRQSRVPLPVDSPIWGSFFTVAPLVLVGTMESDDDAHDLAPKHMAMPLGWSNFFCFACSPRHATQQNAERSGEFTVSFPRPEQVVETSLAAGPRDEGGEKPSLAGIPTFRASRVQGVLVRDAYLWLECRLERVIEGFGENSLIIGEIVAAAVDADFKRDAESDDADLIASSPLLAYLSPGRFARIQGSNSFPYHTNFRL
jgi:flavin reductase (DIM6/NTAB) family NADH-FMN oxidoreductase RutF